MSSCAGSTGTSPRRSIALLETDAPWSPLWGKADTDGGACQSGSGTGVARGFGGLPGPFSAPRGPLRTVEHHLCRLLSSGWCPPDMAEGFEMSATEMVNHPTDGAIPRRPQQGVCSFHIESAKATYRFTRG